MIEGGAMHLDHMYICTYLDIDPDEGALERNV